eukprot:1195500-Prorocentrum_minimum.AAC.26
MSQCGGGVCGRFVRGRRSGGAKAVALLTIFRGGAHGEGQVARPRHLGVGVHAKRHAGGAALRPKTGAGAFQGPRVLRAGGKCNSNNPPSRKTY